MVGAWGPDTTFYFAEGTTRNNATDGAFEEWVSFQNATDKDANVAMTFFTSEQGTKNKTALVAANSRRTLSVNDLIGADIDAACQVTSDQPILVERPMYFNFQNAWDGGHDVMGCNTPKKSWYFAEGTTNSDFITFVAVMNPGNSDADVTFSYLLGDGTNKEFKTTIGPKRRYTRNILEDAGANQDVSILVEGNVDIVAERPMYFNYHAWCTGGSDTLGYGI